MASTQRSPWWRRPLGVLATLAIAGSGLAAGVTGAQANEALPSSPAPVADTVELTGGELDWGVSKFFRDYITGNIAKGSIVPDGGASSNPDGTLRFPAVALDSTSKSISFAGSVAFSGHKGALSTTISDIRIDLTQGLLLADVRSISMSSGALETYDDVRLATVDVTGVQDTGSAFVATALPSAIHADGVPAFSNVFAAGAAFDPVTINVTYKTVVAAPIVGAHPAPASVLAGEAATFTAAATGHESVKWQVSAAGTGPWTDLAGATGEQLVITADLALNGNLYRAAFTNAGGVTYSEPAALTVGDAPKVWTPALSVFAADGVTPLTSAVPEGTKIVVRGTGFDPAANLRPELGRPPIAAGKPAGVYVVFGKFADVWKESAGAPSSARVVGDQKWALSQAAFDAIPAMYQSAVKGQWVEVAGDGSFTAELTVQKKVVAGAPVGWPADGNFGAYTYAAGGTVNASQELYAPITVGDAPKVWTPALSVFAADGVTPLTSAVPEGTKIVVRGTGFDPAANLRPELGRPPIAAGKPAGVYVVFGKFADVWKESAGAPSSARVVGDQKWALSQAAFDAIPAMYQSAVKGQWVEVA
ncbi:HtaA domain-containing protein, partial [Arthrobacter sp. GMC3]|uniref:HtaA domain-containing protein n=1 Tax=Arthrobacter sp. GMC3 TaxID=2058894 RepID=UPI0015E35EC5